MGITDGSVHDVHLLDQLTFDGGSIYVFNREYLDFKRLFQIDTANAFYGTSDNAVRTQLFIAMCVYPMVAVSIRFME